MLKDFTQEKFDIIIQAGQSNSEGFGVGPVDEPYEPNDSVWYLNQDFTVSLAAESVTQNEVKGTFALSFAREYLKAGLLKEGRKLLIVRSAVGNTCFSDGHWTMDGDCYLRMMEMIRTALSLNSENRLIALLWHEGEGDAVMKATHDAQYEHLTEMLASVRKEFSVPALPFLAGDFVHSWRDDCIDICEPVVTAIRDFCRDSEYSAFVETDDLVTNFGELHRATPCGKDMIEDPIHFSRRSLYILGKRYFDAFTEMTKS